MEIPAVVESSGASLVTKPKHEIVVRHCACGRVPKYVSNESYSLQHVNDAGKGNRMNKSSAVAEMGDRLATIDVGQKSRGCHAPFR